MAQRYPKVKGRSETGQFALLPHHCLSHENYTRLSHKAARLLVDLLYQYNGKNNGDLTAAFSILQKRGWRSKETVRLAILELLHYGWIVLTRRGALNRIPSLYAITFHAIDECNGKIDVAASNVPSGNWKNLVGKWEKPEKYKAIDERRKRNRELQIKKSLERAPYLIDTDTVPIQAKKE